MQSWVDGVNEAADKALAHEGSPRDLLVAWFEAYVALISLHKGGPAKITSALGDEASPIHTKCQALTGATDRVLARLREEARCATGWTPCRPPGSWVAWPRWPTRATSTRAWCARCSRSSPTACWADCWAGPPPVRRAAPDRGGWPGG